MGIKISISEINDIIRKIDSKHLISDKPRNFIKLHKSYILDEGFIENRRKLARNNSLNYLITLKSIFRSLINKDFYKAIYQFNQLTFFLFLFLLKRVKMNVNAKEVLIYSSVVLITENNTLIKISGNTERNKLSLIREYENSLKVYNLTTQFDVAFKIPKPLHLDKMNFFEQELITKNKSQSFSSYAIICALIEFYEIYGIQKVLVKQEEYYIDNDLQNLLELLNISITHKNKIKIILSENKFMLKSFIHYDLAKSNMIVDEKNDLYIIDWAASKEFFIVKDLFTIDKNILFLDKILREHINIDNNVYSIKIQILLSEFFVLIEYLNRFKKLKLSKSNKIILRRMIQSYNDLSTKILTND